MSFASASTSLFPSRSHLPAPPPPAPALDILALQSASRVLHAQFLKDAQAVPDLGDMISLPGGQSSALYSISPDDSRTPFQKTRLIKIPAEAFRFFGSPNVDARLGFLSEIERVFLTINNKMVLWNYVEGNDLETYTDQQDLIKIVKLVKPKPGVFIDEINYVLVICTLFSITLLGVSAQDAPGPGDRTGKGIKLYETDLSLKSLDVEITHVVGMSDGRIFMSGQDGAVYELHYQEKEGWFGKRIQLINHSIGGVQSFLPLIGSQRSPDPVEVVIPDISRNLFYTLNSASVITVYQPLPNKSLHQAQTFANLCKLAQEKAPGSPALTPAAFKIVDIHPVPSEESRLGIYFVALTTNGVRLFFGPSIVSYGYQPISNDTRTYRQLQLIHVRLPPSNLLHPDEQSQGYVAPRSSYASHAPHSSRPYVLSSIERSWYSEGIMLAAQLDETGDKSHIFGVVPDLPRIGTFGQPLPQQPSQLGYSSLPAPQRPPLAERAVMLSIDTSAWDIIPVPRSGRDALINSIRGTDSQNPSLLNELAYQFLQPPQQILVLASDGIHVIVKRRALDWLKDALEEAHSQTKPQPIIDFRDRRTCAMLLALASGNTFIDAKTQSASGTLTTLPSDLSSFARTVFCDCGERPVWAERTTYGSADPTGTAIYSGRREGLVIYFSRLVRPIWKNKLTKPGPGGLNISNLPEDLLIMVKNNLCALKDFLDKNPLLFHSSASELTGARATAAADQEAWKAEQHSVAELQALLGRTIEGITFFVLLNDHRLGELISRADTETQKLITGLTFEDFMTTDKGVAASRALVNAVIDQQIGQQIGVDTISDILQSRCGSFCSTDDVMLYKAKENTRRAVETHTAVERQTYLTESLRLFMKGARILDFDQLREVVGDYQQLDFAKGAIELPLHCAQAGDADGRGLEYWHSVPDSSLTDSDPRKEFWERRARCYDLVLDSLDVFEQKTAKGGQDAERARAHAYELAFVSMDEMFHCRLYEWLIGRRLADELLEMRPPYLEAYLRRDPPALEKYQLLWQFYVKDGQPLRAAEVLGTLAESVDFALLLPERIECLTLAVGNAKSHPVAIGGQHESAIAFLTDLEEKLEVAQVQLETYNALCQLANPQASVELRERLDLLDKGLLNVSELYQLYADPFDLPTIKLLILHVSQHRDERLVKEIWSKLVDDIIESHSPADAADKLQRDVVLLGQRFYPSDAAFPFRHVASQLATFQLTNTSTLPPGWSARILVACGVPYPEVWEVMHQMYESQIPPFNTQAAITTLAGGICVLLSDWVEAAKRSSSDQLPVARIYSAVDQYLQEATDQATRDGYERIRRELRRNW
ncbi:nucleoporin [Vararia minispora EC-137]|uniref:Nucleoporin n=1 Tax=Vararia minispora EC-137 TaxID=1314806 RepID=A0ACB8QPU0_9AGAM|nr:nucleoporin [Vararia minispora EC-137]